jgi:hypothetical protein
MVPVYVAAASPVGFAETLIVCGVVRVPEGDTESQIKPPLAPEALTEIRTAVESVTESDLWMIVALPAAAAKDSEVGEIVRGFHPS